MTTAPIFGEVYVHTCTANEKSYVGQTTQGMTRRWGRHLTASRIPKALAYNGLLSKAIRKYGADAFEHRVLSVACSAAELDNLEKVWIILLQTKQPLGYNITSGGSTWTSDRRARASARKREFSPEGHAALVRNGQDRKGCKQSPEAIEKTAAANRGRVKSSEECLKLSISHQGKQLLEETKQKISISRTGHKDSPETCAKKAASKNTPEARAANSARAKSQFSSPESRAAVRALRGTPEARAKSSEIKKAWWVAKKAVQSWPAA